MKGMESLIASMMGVDANKMQEMMSGFIDNAAYLAKSVDEIKASIESVNNRLANIEAAILISNREGSDYVESDN